jgi:hypothetical protein
VGGGGRREKVVRFGFRCEIQWLQGIAWISSIESFNPFPPFRRCIEFPGEQDD